MTKLRQSSILLLATFFLVTGCHKNDTSNTIFEQFFEDNVLGQTFVITYANNQGTDLTAQYSGYNFVLQKGSDFYNGVLRVTKAGVTYSGTWSSNQDYSKLNIILPSSPVEFNFLTRSWRFASKQLPVLKFTPWGGPDDIQLTMTRQ